MKAQVVPLPQAIYTTGMCSCGITQENGKKDCCKKYKRKGKFCGGCPKK